VTLIKNREKTEKKRGGKTRGKSVEEKCQNYWKTRWKIPATSNGVTDSATKIVGDFGRLPFGILPYQFHVNKNIQILKTGLARKHSTLYCKTLLFSTATLYSIILHPAPPRLNLITTKTLPE
jgi:hypothetical protein